MLPGELDAPPELPLLPAVLPPGAVPLVEPPVAPVPPTPGPPPLLFELAAEPGVDAGSLAEVLAPVPPGVSPRVNELVPVPAGLPGVVEAPEAPVLPPAPLVLVPASLLFEPRPHAERESASATPTAIRMSLFIVDPRLNGCTGNTRLAFAIVVPGSCPSSQSKCA